VRVVFLFLLLANVAFFAWWRYGGGADAADPAPLSRQIEPESLKVVTPDKLPPAPEAAKPAPPAQPVPLAPPAPAPAVPVPAAAPAPVAACIEWGSFTLADAPKAEQALAPLELGARLAQRRTDELAGWWVFMPPQPS
jgi:hypothetical protein